MGPVGHLVILPRAATLPDYLRHCIALPETADSAPEHGSAPVSITGGAAQVGCRADGGPCAAGSQQGIAPSVILRCAIAHRRRAFRREPGIHRPAHSAEKWIPGSCFARPGM